MAPRVTNLALQYVTTGVALSSSWKVMKPHMSSLLASVVFPLCCFDDEDEELWDDDPQEYIRKVNEPGGSFCRMSAAEAGGGEQTWQTSCDCAPSRAGVPGTYGVGSAMIAIWCRGMT